ncbi:MAG: diguanylate cyclase [Thermobacillus sp. ZCTH02-B1]|uniref:sensor domain-containing diguanylate cyclase n=1 Tax=Thermobacillus sp. ZCTH02-B1 TaxID=1858795 RepID=UPI000B55C433|nr:sensor domain-containing diguanylate cyclase [Thermobacillus sp. ZCTH02-B1]OUM96462.1 MAG: diguanylate cyclase [Thermobacillus sp. ZCTH02-B1]
MRDHEVDGSPSPARNAGEERNRPIRPLLADSFGKWLEEIRDGRAWSGCAFLLFGIDGETLARSGDVPEEAEAALQHCALRAVRSGAAVEADRTPDGTFLAAYPVAEPDNRSICAALGFVMPSDLGTDACRLLTESGALHFRGKLASAAEHRLLHRIMLFQREADKIWKRKDLLYDSVRRLHDQIDVPSLLKEIIRIIETLFPGAELELHLSQDHAAVDRRIKPLVFKQGVDEICARSFLESRPITEYGEDGSVEVAVPFSGKQAVYGVLDLKLKAGEWNEAELPHFVMLAQEAGSAFEHAKLYEQSNQLIAELQLINDMAKRLNRSLRPQEIFEFVTTEFLNVFKAEFCCVLQFDRDERRFVVVSSNIPELVNERFPSDYGFCGVVMRTREPLIISDYRETGNVPSKLMEITGARSLIASPIFVDGEVGGVILVAHRSPNFFSYDNYKLLQVISSHVGLAVANATLHAAVRRMVITDHLTGLHARHYLNEQIQLRQRQDPAGSLILVDIDYFKRVNDTYGHQIGDRILIQVSHVIKSCIRETDIAARWGGEELAVYLPLVRIDQALRVAERIRQRVEAETDPDVTVSCGVSEWTRDDEKISPETLFYRADMALYAAKNHGRNRVIAG